MALVTIGELTALECCIRLPTRGVWTVEAVLQTGATPTERVALKTPGRTLSGTVSPGGGFVERNFVRLVGGAGGLRKPLSAKGYRDVEARTIVGDLLRAAGESLASTSDAKLLAKRFAHWTRGARAAGIELDSLAESLGATWRVLDDGAVWIGRDTWPTVTFDHRVMEDRPDLKRSTIASDEPTLSQGVTFLGRRVLHVEHRFLTEKTRTVYEYE